MTRRNFTGHTLELEPQITFGTYLLIISEENKNTKLVLFQRMPN